MGRIGIQKYGLELNSDRTSLSKFSFNTKLNLNRTVELNIGNESIFLVYTHELDPITAVYGANQTITKS